MTDSPAQLSGNFRLTALTGDQLSCYTAANQGRSTLGLPLVIPDEYLTELAVGFAQVYFALDTDFPPSGPAYAPYVASIHIPANF